MTDHDDPYLTATGRLYATGLEALVRLPIEIVRLDRRCGLRTRAFVSGYEGSPLAGYDLQLKASGAALIRNGIHFVPGLNEDLAATAIFGTQLAETVENRIARSVP